MSSVGFKPANPASERPQTRGLYRAATGIESIIDFLCVFVGKVLNILPWRYILVFQKMNYEKSPSVIRHAITKKKKIFIKTLFARDCDV